MTTPRSANSVPSANPNHGRRLDSTPIGAAHNRQKIVDSTGLETVITATTRIERDFDPDVVGQMKASAGRDLTVGGASLAAHAFKAGLVDECRLFVVPIVAGGGKRSLPDNVRVELELLDERRSAEG
jgi:dihydrofolate reductase